MKIVAIIPKEIVILNEFTVENIKSLIFCLEHCSVEYDQKDETKQKQVDYFTDVFYKTLLELEKRLENVS